MCRGLGSDRSSQYRKGKGFAHFFWKFLVTCCHSGQHSAPFHLWKAQTPQGTGICKGAAEGETSGLQRSPVRAEAAEGRRGDSKERKGEKEGKDKRKKGQSWVEGPAHVWGPQVEEQATAPRQPESQSLRGLGSQWGLPGGIPVRSAEELPSLSLGIRSLPLHRHKKMTGKNKHKGALLRQLQCQTICHKKPGWLSINPPDSPQGPTTMLHPASTQDRQKQAALPRPPHGH